MAELDPYAPNDTGRNYLGYSKGTIPDSSTGGLLSDVGSIVQQAATAGSQFLQTRAREEFTAGADEIRDTFTGRRTFDRDATQSRLGMTGPDSPQELKDYSNRLEALSQSYASGRVRESHYWMLMDMEARKVRQRYPGFRTEIDSMISSVTGGNPANQLASSLRTEANEAGGTEARNAEHWLRQATEHGTPSALNYAALTQAGRRPTTLQLQNEVANAQRHLRQTAAEGARLTQDHQRGVNTTDNATRSFVGALDFQFRNVFNSAASQFGQQRGEFEANLARAQEAARTGQLAPRQLQELAAQWNGLRPQVMANAQSFLHAPSNPDDAQSQNWWTLIGNPDKANGVIKGHMEAFDAVGMALSSGDFSLLNYFKRNVDITEQGNVHALYQRSPVLQHYGALRQILGPQMMTSQLLSPTANSDLQNILSTIIAPRTLGVVTGNDTLGGVLGALPRDPSLTPGERNGAAREVLNRSLTHLGTKDMPIEAVTMAAQGLFGPGNERVLQSFGNRSEVYMQMAGSPDVVQNMIRLRDSGPQGAQQFQQYRSWVLGNFSTLMREQGQTLQGMALNNTNSELRFDPQTFTYSLTPVGPGGQQGSGYVTTGGQAAVNRINQTLLGVRTLIQAETGNPEQTNAVMAQALRGLGVDLNRANQGSVPGNMWEGMINGLRSIVGDPQGPSYGPRSQQGSQPHQVAPLLDVIGRGEATHGYNQRFDGNFRGINDPNLTNMTLAQVLEMQRGVITEQRSNGVRDGEASSAAGRYQFLQGRIQDAIKEMGLDPSTTLFNNRTQDAMATHFLKKMGLDDYLRNPNPTARARLVDAMSNFWAALPNSTGTGRGNLDGVGRNRANRSNAEVERALDELLTRYGRG